MMLAFGRYVCGGVMTLILFPFHGYCATIVKFVINTKGIGVLPLPLGIHFAGGFSSFLSSNGWLP